MNKTTFIPQTLAGRAAHYMQEMGWNVTQSQLSNQFAINVSDDAEFLADLSNALNLAEQDRTGQIDCDPVVK